MNKKRTTVGALALSAAGLIALVSHEGYREKAYVPVPGDRPTVGFGSTFNPDGTPVKLGDTVTPQKALRMTLVQHFGLPSSADEFLSNFPPMVWPTA